MKNLVKLFLGVVPAAILLSCNSGGGGGGSYKGSFQQWVTPPSPFPESGTYNGTPYS